MRRKAIFLLSATAFVVAQAAHAQQWNDPNWTDGSVPAPVWVEGADVGDGIDRFPEISTSAQGGDPPALAYEPAAIDEDGRYDRDDWLIAPTLPGDRFDNGEAKFRLTCEFGFFGDADPIVAFGEVSPHHHTFIGNMGVFEDGGIEAVRTATYEDLREHPKSSCAGGPDNATLYWEPTLFYEIGNGVVVPVKPNVVSFYYTLDYEKTALMYRLLRGLSFIGGVNPADRFNTARQAELNPSVWQKEPSKRYNGWVGWVCFDPQNGGVPLDAGNDADANGSTYARQLVNDDGSDPWAGACEDSDFLLIASNVAPNCWDGHNLTSPNGRDHFRYAVQPAFDGSPLAVECPDGWWQVAHFEVKTEFPNGYTATGDHGHAYRSKIYLSSDRMDPDPGNWQPPGSTFHFDWMNGWDSVIQSTWQDKCTGTDQNGNSGEPLTCGDSTISATQKLSQGTPPDTDFARTPIVTQHTYFDEAPTATFGDVVEGATVDVTISHDHTD